MNKHIVSLLRRPTLFVTLAALLFSFPGCSSDPEVQALLEALLGGYAWRSTEYGSGEPTNEPHTTEQSGEGNQQGMNLKENGDYTHSYDYGQGESYTISGKWEVEDNEMIFDRGEERERRYNINKDGNQLQLFQSVSTNGTAQWVRENWQKTN